MSTSSCTAKHSFSKKISSVTPTSTRDLFKYTLLRDREKREKTSTAPVGIRTHGLLFRKPALNLLCPLGGTNMIMNNYVLITFLYSQEFPHQLSNPVRASVNVLKSIFLNIVSFGIYFLGEFKSKPFLCFDFLSILCQRILVDTLRMRNRDCERVSDRLREGK